MKQFYAIEPKHDMQCSSRKLENVEYDINTLITEAAEMCVCVDSDCSDEEWENAVNEKAKEIKEQLMRDGIWRNELGYPVFLYC